MAEIVVVGSANIDRTVVVAHFPEPGETVTGGPVAAGQGGKGANQAVVAARFGRSVAFVGRVGSDADGRSIRADLRSEGVDVSYLRDSPGPSGAAFICVDPHAENFIVVSPGANALVTREDVAAATDQLVQARVLLVQLEVPLEAVKAALELAVGVRVLNPAPARPLPEDLLSRVDVLIPNTSELGTLTGTTCPSAHAEIAELASILGVDNVIVTLGADGALVINHGKYQHLPALPVRPVDTTGAGDTFCATVADGLARDLSLIVAAKRAVRAAGRATTAKGARPRVPLSP